MSSLFGVVGNIHSPAGCCSERLMLINHDYYDRTVVVDGNNLVQTSHDEYSLSTTTHNKKAAVAVEAAVAVVSL
jgi:hypothetical protein